MTEIKGRTLAKFDDGYFQKGKNVVAGTQVGKKEGYSKLENALGVAEKNSGSEVITKNDKDGKYYVNQVSDKDFGNKESSQSQIKEYKSKDFIKVVAFTDSKNNVVSRAKNNDNLSKIGDINTVVSRLKAIKGKVPEEKRLAFVALTLGIGTNETLGTMKNIKLTLKKVPDHLSTELKEKYKEFIKPENIEILAGAMALYGASHLTGAGEVADVVLTGAGIVSLGSDTKKVASNFYSAYNSINEAKTDKDLDNAAKQIAKGLTTIATNVPLGVGTYKGVKNLKNNLIEIERKASQLKQLAVKKSNEIGHELKQVVSQTVGMLIPQPALLTSMGTKSNAVISDSVFLAKKNNKATNSSSISNVSKISNDDLQSITGPKYSKHWPNSKDNKKFDEKSLEAKTKNNKELIYNRKVKIDELEQKAWINGEKTAREDHRIYKNDVNVGYANGKETQYLQIKKTGNEIHGHPITEERYNELKSKGKK